MRNQEFFPLELIIPLKLLVIVLHSAEGWGSLGGFGNTGGLNSDVAPRHGDLPKLSRHLRYVLFPETGTMGLFLALAIPLDLPHKSVSLSWNFEANYYLPYNATELAEPPGGIFRDTAKGEGQAEAKAEGQAEGKANDEEERSDGRRRRRARGNSPSSMDRTRFYALLETHLQSAGLAARPCLLRAICEASEMSLRHNGLVGDLLHVLLTPSTSEDEGLPAEFEEAEKRSEQKQDCQHYYSKYCPVSVLDMISVVVSDDID